jgi:putative nucleotidyltransferase with HDIG domain
LDARREGFNPDRDLPNTGEVFMRRTALTLVAGAVLALSSCGAVLSSRAADWRPFPLLALLLVLAVVSDLVIVEIRNLRLSGAFLALVLAMALLGPAPAATLGAVSAAIDAVRSRRPRDVAWANVATYAAFPLTGGLAVAALAPAGAPRGGDPFEFAALVFAVFMAMNALNFALIAAALSFGGRAPMRAMLRSFATALPTEVASALLTAGVAFTYARLGIASVGLAAVVLLVFQYILRASVQAQDRGEELELRTRELASLQVGLLSTVLQTLSMRDSMTARHSAAVARYSREVAELLGLSEREQDLIHTAALLHDIGKFIFPDSILFADRKLTDAEWATVKLHPEQGARLVGGIEGYGPVAEIVMHHHERFSGGGYPTGIAGEAIPLGSRIIAAADTYDVMTSRDSYRRPVSSEAALAELRRVSGTQLDPEVVEAFERVILERRVRFNHVDQADFESELAFERRVADYARPRVAAYT